MWGWIGSGGLSEWGFKMGWLKEILEENRRTVASWPTWKRKGGMMNDEDEDMNDEDMNDEDMDDGLNGARGVALGAVLGLVLWAMLFTIGLEVWYLLDKWGVRP